MLFSVSLGFPGGSAGKKPAMKRHRRHELDPWVGKILWRKKWQPTPVFLPGEFRGQRSLAGYSPWDLKELEVTEQEQGNFIFKSLIYLEFILCNIWVRDKS